MKCVIIEDDEVSQEVLLFKLKKDYKNITVLKVISNRNTAIEFLRENDEIIDFIFLDIEIDDGLSFEILDVLQNYSFKIIFLTAHKKYAFEAFKKNVIHYLIKPIKDNELAEAISRIILKEKKENLIISDFKKILKLDQQDIFYLKSDGSYTEIYLQDKKILSTRNIGEHEKILDSNMFCRIHHSYIVNLKHVEQIEKGRCGIVHLKNKSEIPISQRKMKSFLDKLKQEL